VTLYNFESLSRFEQTEAVLTGTLLAHRKDGFFHITLYQIDSFYVEVYYHKDDKTILHLHPFLSIRFLDPYLEQIDLTGKF